MSDDRSIRVRLIADISSYRDGLKQAARATADFGGEVGAALGKMSGQQMADVGMNLNRYVTLPLIAAGGAAVKLAVDFDETFNRMQGLAGVAAGEVGELRDAVLDLAGETAQSPQQLAEGLYFVRSAGIDGVAAMEVLEAAAKGAASGLGSTASVADLLTSVLGAYGEANISAAEAADVLTATAREGKAEASALAPQMGRLLPIASELGIEFNEVGAAMAYMSRSGGGAELASTNLGNVLQKLLTPAQEGVTALEAIGLTTDDLRASIADRGLLGTLVMLRTTLEENGLQLGDFSRDAQFTTGVLALTANGGRDAQAVFDALGDSAGSAGAAFEAAAQGPGFELRQSLADVQVSAIKLGDSLAPIAAGVAGGVANIATAFGNLPGPAQTGTLAVLGLAAASGPVLTLVGNIQRVQEKLRELGPAGERAAAGVGKVAMAAGGAAAIAGMAFSLEALHDVVESALVEDAPALDAMGLALVGFAQNASISGALVDAFGQDLSGLADDLELLEDRRRGVHIDIFEDFDEAVGRIDSVDKALAKLVDAGHEDVAEQIFDELVAGFEGTGVSAGDLRRELGDYGSALDRSATAARLAVDPTGELGESFVLQQQRAEDLTKELQDYQDQLRALSDPLFGMANAVMQNQEAQLAYSDAVTAVTTAEVALAEAQANHADDSEEVATATRDLANAHRDVESALLDTARASFGLDGASQTLATAVANGETSVAAARAELERMATQSGQSEDQIAQLIARFELLVAAVDGRVLSFTVDQRHRVFGAISPNTPVLGIAGSQHAEGGRIPGVGSGDTYPAWLMPGEFVLRAAAARRIGYRELDMWNHADRFATGGVVGAAAASESGYEAQLSAIASSGVGRAVVAGLDAEQARQALEGLTDAYRELISRIGVAAGEQVLWMSSSEEQFDRMAGFATDAADRLDVMFDVGDLGTDEYLAILQERLAGTELYSSEWADIWGRIDEVQEQRVDEQRRLEDSLHEIGTIGNADYKAILEARLADTEQFSDEWFDLWKQINQITQDAADEQARILQDIRSAQRGVTDSAVSDLSSVYQAARDEAAETGEGFEAVLARHLAAWRAAIAETQAAEAWAAQYAAGLRPSTLASLYPGGAQAVGDANLAQFMASPYVQSYDTGGWLQPGRTMAYYGTGAPERVGNDDVVGGAGGQLFGDVYVAETADVTSMFQRAAIARKSKRL